VPNESNRARPSYEELQHQISLLEQKYALCERLRMANNFAAATIHEVNNPLEAIGNLLYLAQQENASQTVALYLEQIQEQMTMLSSISRSSLSFHRGQAHSQRIDLQQIVNSALKLHHGRLAVAEIRIVTRCEDDVVSFGIASEILQVFSNLILNAADALLKTVRPTISIKIRAADRWIHFAIADNGPGVPEHVQGQMFQAHSTGKESGAGMGLWLSKRIIGKHGGNIRFRTSRHPGRSGTLFAITLPRYAAA